LSLIHWRLNDPEALSWKMVFFVFVGLASLYGLCFGAFALFYAVTTPHQNELLRPLSVACAGMLCLFPYVFVLPVFMLDGDVDIYWTTVFTPMALTTFTASLMLAFGGIVVFCTTNVYRKMVMFVVVRGATDTFTNDISVTGLARRASGASHGVNAAAA
jgi:hypothetical protein